MTVTTIPTATTDPVPGDSDAQVSERGERSGTLIRGLKILEELANTPRPLTLAEVTSLTSLDQSTVHRLLKALEEAGYVVRSESTRRYAPSPKLMFPLKLLHPLNRLRRECAPALHELALRLRKTTALAVFMGNERVMLDIAQAPGSVTPYYGMWLQGPLHSTGSGKSLLASLEVHRRHALLGKEPLRPVTPKTIVDLETLDNELEESRRLGYVTSRDEDRSGISDVSTPISSWSGAVVGCLIATGTSKEFDDATCEAIGAELKQAADLLTYQAPSLESLMEFIEK